MKEFALDPGEEIILMARKHWLVFLGVLLPYIFLALLPLLLPAIFETFSAHYPQLEVAIDAIPMRGPIIQGMLGIWWLILWIGAFNSFVSYFLNVWIITSARIVQIEQTGFFNRQVSSFLLGRVQDITTDIHGILADLFRYGTVRVETAGTASHLFSMEGVADPVAMRDLIMKEIALLHKESGV